MLISRGLEDLGKGVEEGDVKVVCLTDGLEEAGGWHDEGQGSRIGISEFRPFE